MDRLWHLHRPQRLTPRQALAGYALAAALLLPVGTLALWAGFAPVAGFAVLELLALLAALVVQARHACDAETLQLRGPLLHLERRDGAAVEHLALPAAALRVEPPTRGQDLVTLCLPGRRIEVGRHLATPGRHQLARELRAALR